MRPGRDTSGKWAKGSSGNPGGRVRLTKAQREGWEKIRKFAPEFADELLLWAKSGEPKMAPHAWKILAERIFPQRQAVNPFELPDDVAELSAEEQVAHLQSIIKVAGDTILAIEKQAAEDAGEVH